MRFSGINIFFRKYQFFILLFVDLLFVILYSQVILGLYQDNQSMANTVYTERSKQTLLLNRSVKLTEMHSDFIENSVVQEAVEGSYISQDDTFGFLSLIESLAEDNNIVLSMDLGSFPEDIADTSVFSVTLKISARGTYVDGMKFLQSLETLPYYIQVRDLNIRSSSSSVQSFLQSDSVESDDLDFSITAYTLWY